MSPFSSRYLYMLVLFFVGPYVIEAQEDEKVQEPSQNQQFLIENQIEDANTEEFDFDTQFEDLAYFAKNPININDGTDDDLNRLGILSSLQVKSLLLYRRKYGRMYSVYELANVPGLDNKTIERLLPYIQVDKVKSKELFRFDRLKWSRSQLFIRWQRQLELPKGYRDGTDTTQNSYAGSPDKLYLRYRLTYKDKFSVGFTAEKDPGEEFFNGSNPAGFDYYSGHIFLKDISKTVNAVAIGDFQLLFGQGLTMWSGFGMRKGPQVNNIKRISSVIRPYTSVNESLYNRGIGTKLHFLKDRNLQVTLFASHRFRDANLTEDIDSTGQADAFNEVLSLQDYGYHRTESELENENNIQHISAGTRVEYKADNWNIAANVIYNYLSNPIGGTDLRPYQRFNFTGNTLLNASIDYSFLYKKYLFFGETAMSSNLGFATLNGLIANMHSNLTMSFLHRYYSPNYFAFLGNAFGETSRISNEQGMYVGIAVSLARGLSLDAYFDLFSFPWLRFTVDAPSRGAEFLAKLNYKPTYYIETYLQYKFERKGINLPGNEGRLDELIDSRRHQLRAHISYKVSRNFSIRTRAEMSYFQTTAPEFGVMVYQDLVVHPQTWPIKVHFRLAYFDTESYNTRIYAYENDVLYSFSVLPYYGRGIRAYVNLSAKINRNISLWFRIAQTHFVDRDVISSGLLEVEGPRRTEIKAQLRMKF